MHFINTPLEGAYLIDLDKKEDNRGFFARFFCKETFALKGLKSNFIQINTSVSNKAFTLRGIHYQLHPKSEVKIVRCIKGSLFDVIVDLRPESPTFLKWFGEYLTENNRRMMYVPEGFGHAFLTLAPDTEAFYLVSSEYSLEHERGLLWSDPKINIHWPKEPEVISEKDRSHPEFNAAYHLSSA